LSRDDTLLAHGGAVNGSGPAALPIVGHTSDEEDAYGA
jgi:hypothetical protein